jgi:hypothetical protein
MAKKKEKTSISKAPSSPLSPSSASVVVKQVVVAFTIACVLFVIFRENKGYQWVWNSLIQENLKLISKNKYATDAQKMQAKFGIDAAVIDYIAQKTPKDAIILFPPNQVLMNDSASYKFLKQQGGIKNRYWTTDLLYPRKLVYFDELDKNIWKDAITHVVVFDGWGLQYLSYTPENITNFEVYPINR